MTPTSNKYVPLLELGRGGMATVYLSVARGPGGFCKLQVIKQLRPELASDPEFLQMFLEEARLSARINHPNVVQTHEVGTDGQHHFIAMEFLDGQALEAVLRALERPGGRDRVALPVLLRMLCDALSGLHYAHELSGFDGKPLCVVHRDISPHNIFVTYEGVVKVVDFGIAKAADSGNETRTGVLKGKAPYMSPEQVLGLPLDRRTDVFAAGAVLYRMITGRRLWKGLSEMEIFCRLSEGKIPSPEDAPDVAPELAAICARALAPEVDDRFATALEMQEALEGYLSSVDARPTGRDVGRALSELFAERRAEVKVAIENRLRAVETEQPIQVTDLFPQDTTQIVVTTGAGAPHGARRKRRGELWMAASLFLIVGLFGVSTAILYRRGEGSTVVVREVVSASGGGTQAGPPLRATELRIRTVPQEAEVALDDAPLRARVQRMSQDQLSHKITATLPGYETRRELVTFDKEVVEVTIELKKQIPLALRGAPEAPRPRDSSAEAKEPPSTPPPDTSTPTPKEGSGLQIDRHLFDTPTPKPR